MKKKILGAAAVLAIATTPMFATAHGDGKTGGQHGDRRGEGHGMVRLIEMIEIYDVDGDGSVSQEEIDQRRAERFGRFDADGDGRLSLEEYQALWLDAMRERMIDRFQAHDDDGDGEVTAEEFGERTSNIVLMRDRNGDGVLSIDDARRGRHSRSAAPAQPDAPAQQ